MIRKTILTVDLCFTWFLLMLLFFPSHAQNFGEQGHPMNKSTDSREILKYWETTPDADQALYESAYQILSSNKYGSYADLMTSDSFKNLVREQGRKILAGPMLGQIKANKAAVWVRTLQPSKVEVEIKHREERFIFGPVYATIETDLSAVIEIDGLKPSTRYPYKIIVNGKVIPSDVEQVITTLPELDNSEKVKIAFGSCPHRWGLGNHKLLERIRKRGNHAMLLLGDIAVQDRNDHLGLHRADYLLRDLLPAWQDFASKVPVYASWDDHDYFDNDKAGIPEGYSAKDRHGVRKVFQHSWVNSSYGQESLSQGIFTRERIGPFDIIMTDNRFYRTGKKGSFLGKSQMDWLKEQLSDCKGPFIILSCGTMWSDYVSDGKDSWGVNDPDGREEIFKYIEDNGISGVLLISGDRHGARGFTIPRKSDFGFFEFEAASLGARVGPPAKDPSWNTQLYGIDGEFAFGEFTFLPSSDDPAVVFRLVGEDGDHIFERTIKRSELTP
ncbi:alkaline phosphatase D family protein [Cyclobacterium lianum]|uniref:alkaline phosphatase D family protein n=1 Tax=Cyclobacterium lianum TaxID=388280 RepID=UPI001C49EF10|nr:alkaline phosphatase D family protein [Cyclobacterium lianum]